MDIFKIGYEKIKLGLKKAIWPGRLEMIKKNVYIDGAHNISAILELTKNIKKIFENKKVKILFSALKDKDISSMLKIFENEGYEIMLTEFPDFRFESLELLAIDKNYQYIKDPISYLTNYEEQNILIVTGSLHFIGFLKSNLTHL